MSKWNAVAPVSTLNFTVSPWLTLISVAKPWMAELPAPLMSHSLAGLPTLVFSHAIGLVIGASHGAAWAAGDERPSPTIAASATRTNLVADGTGGIAATIRAQQRPEQ